MRAGGLVLAASLALVLAGPPDAAAKPFRFATTSDATTLDPHANNAFTTYFITAKSTRA
jgi:ABC-type transport system substrate-binding protein